MNKAQADLRQPVRGARDFYPEDLAVRNYLFTKWRQVAKLFGYEEIDGPILENFDLFAAKSGEELVSQQMYTLSDRDERKLGLRPEITPTYSRMVAKKQGELTFPLRWTMFGNVWRYEKPQKGRVRDFWQWEINLIGGEESLADAEIITVGAKAMEAVGLGPEDIVFRVNDRRHMQEQLVKKIGISQNLYGAVSKAIDRKEKAGPGEFNKQLKEIGLTETQTKKLTQFLNQNDYSNSQSLTKLFSLLESYGVADYVQYDPTIVRGITYYTGVVFECFDRSKKYRSVFGGGRFDDLVETFGGGKVPAVGFAIGDVVITELLKDLGKLPQNLNQPSQVLVTIFSPQELETASRVANLLRESDISAELYPDAETKLDKQLKYADKKNIPWVVVIGPEEVKVQKVVLKNMQTGNQETIPESILAEEIKA